MCRPAMILLLAVSLSSVWLPAQRPQLSQQRAHAWAWIHAAHREHPEMFQALKALGFDGLSVEAGPGMGERLPALGRGAYIDQALPGDVLHLRPKTWESAQERSLGLSGNRQRPLCLSDTKALAAVEKEMITRMAPLGKNRPDFISLRDEPSFTRMLNPADWCTHPACRKAFGQWLVKRWGSQDAANKAWVAELGKVATAPPTKSLSPPAPPKVSDTWPTPITTDAARSQLFHSVGSRKALTAWNDARAFNDHLFASTIARWCDLLRARHPGIPLGVLGGQTPDAFGGYDWEQLLPGVDVVEPYDYGAAHALVSGLKPAHVAILHTLFKPENPSHLKATANEIWHYALRDVTGFVAYSTAELFKNGDPKSPTPWAKIVGMALLQWRTPAWDAWRRAQPIKPTVALVHDMPSARLHWLKDTELDGASWPRRLTSWVNEHGTQIRNRVAWQALVDDWQLPSTWIGARSIENGDLLTLESIRVLILPRTLCVSSALRDQLAAFVYRGGLLIADAQAGLYSNQLIPHKKPILDGLFGIARIDRRSNLRGERIRKNSVPPGFPWPVAEPGIKAKGGHPSRLPGGRPVFIAHRPPATRAGGPRSLGETLYLNCFLFDYAKRRLSAPDEADSFRKSFRPFLARAARRTPVARWESVPSSNPWPVFVRTKIEAEGSYLVALLVDPRVGSEAPPADRLLTKGQVAGKLVLDGTWRVENLISGKAFQQSKSLDLEIGPWRPLLLRLSR